MWGQFYTCHDISFKPSLVEGERAGLRTRIRVDKSDLNPGRLIGSGSGYIRNIIQTFFGRGGESRGADPDPGRLIGSGSG